jgi:hypothetical protein
MLLRFSADESELAAKIGPAGLLASNEQMREQHPVRKATLKHIGLAALCRPPMVGNFLIIKMPDARDQRVVSDGLRPTDRFVLSRESVKHVICLVFHYIILDGRPFWPALGTSLYVHVGHNLFS